MERQSLAIYLRIYKNDELILLLLFNVVVGVFENRLYRNIQRGPTFNLCYPDMYLPLESGWQT